MGRLLFLSSFLSILTFCSCQNSLPKETHGFYFNIDEDDVNNNFLTLGDNQIIVRHDTFKIEKIKKESFIIKLNYQNFETGEFEYRSRPHLVNFEFSNDTLKLEIFEGTKYFLKTKDLIWKNAKYSNVLQKLEIPKTNNQQINYSRPDLLMEIIVFKENDILKIIMDDTIEINQLPCSILKHKKKIDPRLRAFVTSLIIADKDVNYTDIQRIQILLRENNLLKVGYLNKNHQNKLSNFALKLSPLDEKQILSRSYFHHFKDSFFIKSKFCDTVKNKIFRFEIPHYQEQDTNFHLINYSEEKIIHLNGIQLNKDRLQQKIAEIITSNKNSKFAIVFSSETGFQEYLTLNSLIRNAYYDVRNEYALKYYKSTYEELRKQRKISQTARENSNIVKKEIPMRFINYADFELENLLKNQ